MLKKIVFELLLQFQHFWMWYRPGEMFPNEKEGIMEKYSDILRRLADLLDADFHGNMVAVVSELASVFASLSKQAAQQSDE